MNQYLIHKNLDLGQINEVKQLQQIDQQLIVLLRKATSFDFAAAIANGSTLLVGEGNFSFALSLASKKQVIPSRIVASTFEKQKDLSKEAANNAKQLASLGVMTIYGVDATKISAVFGSRKFDNIIFQFPHAGSREPIQSHNPNFVLVRDFLKSALNNLAFGGKVIISAVDTPHYRGAFQFDKAATAAGFKAPVSYSFDPADFLGYRHIMTNQDESALNNHEEFQTLVFQK